MVCSLVPESVSSKKENLLKWPLSSAAENSGRVQEGNCALWPVVVRNYSPRKASSTYTHTHSWSVSPSLSTFCFYLKSLELSLWDFCHIWLLLYLCISLIMKVNVCMYLNLTHYVVQIICTNGNLTDLACMVVWEFLKWLDKFCWHLPEDIVGNLGFSAFRWNGTLKTFLLNCYFRGGSVYQHWTAHFEQWVTAVQRQVNLTLLPSADVC